MQCPKTENRFKAQSSGTYLLIIRPNKRVPLAVFSHYVLNTIKTLCKGNSGHSLRYSHDVAPSDGNDDEMMEAVHYVGETAAMGNFDTAVMKIISGIDLDYFSLFAKRQLIFMSGIFLLIRLTFE